MESTGSFFVFYPHLPFSFLPRQFHTAIVENNENHIRTAIGFSFVFVTVQYFCFPNSLGGNIMFQGQGL
jgi:hypothetical protein